MARPLPGYSNSWYMVELKNLYFNTLTKNGWKTLAHVGIKKSEDIYARNDTKT